jgi:hypothetical protein
MVDMLWKKFLAVGFKLVLTHELITKKPGYSQEKQTSSQSKSQIFVVFQN